MKSMDKELKELQTEYDLTVYQAEGVKIAMASYALNAIMDSTVRKEAEEIMKDYEKRQNRLQKTLGKL